jgi:putative SOS response-associated peptidase YedK
MCGRYTLFTPPSAIEERFDATFEQPPQPRYNAAPGQSLPVVTNDAPETIDTLEWGLIPHWADDRTDGNRPINARAETVAEKRSFRDAYESRRCLVLADGFYEWQGTDAGKQPYRVTLDSDEPFAMAGLWERWQPPEKQTGLTEFGDGQPDAETDPVETFTVITTEPNDVVGELHDRMAVVLPAEEERRWLADGAGDLLQPYPGGMTAYPVSTAVNDPSNDRPDLVEEVDAVG